MKNSDLKRNSQLKSYIHKFHCFTLKLNRNNIFLFSHIPTLFLSLLHFCFALPYLRFTIRRTPHMDTLNYWWLGNVVGVSLAFYSKATGETSTRLRSTCLAILRRLLCVLVRSQFSYFSVHLNAIIKYTNAIMFNFERDAETKSVPSLRIHSFGWNESDRKPVCLCVGKHSIFARDANCKYRRAINSFGFSLCFLPIQPLATRNGSLNFT